MSNMSYCRHENTLNDLRDVWEEWDNFDPEDSNEYEIEARQALVDLINEIAYAFRSTNGR